MTLNEFYCRSIKLDPNANEVYRSFDSKEAKEQLKMDTILINEKKINKIFLLCVYRLYYFSFN